jgi:hypothetical protein
MALDYIVEYPGQVIDGDPDYPQGKAQNVGVEGDGTGTPLEAALVNDHFGFLQALLLAAAITPSNTPDTANDSQYLQSIYRLFRYAEGWGAVGDGSTDTTTALQAALDAVAAMGTGIQELHLWPGRIYQVTALNVPANVKIVGHGAMIRGTSGSSDTLTYAIATTTGIEQELVDVRFGGATASTGAAIKLTAAVSLRFRKVSFGASGDTAGRFVDATTGGAKLAFDSGTSFRGRGAANFVKIGGAGRLSLVDCRLTVPSIFTTTLFEIGDSVHAQVDDVECDLTGHTTGAIKCFEITNANVRANFGIVNVIGGIAADIGISWTAAARIIETGLICNGGATRYDSSVVLAISSSLSLMPHGEDSSADETYTLPDDYRSFSLAADFATFPIVFTMPKIRFIGQEYDLQIYNKNVTDWATTPDFDAMGPNLCTPGAPLEGTQIKTGRFRVMRNDFGSNYRWTLVGDWSAAYVRGVTIGS